MKERWRVTQNAVAISTLGMSGIKNIPDFKNLKGLGFKVTKLI